MKCETYSIRHGYDKEKCLVHARCCVAPGFMLATAQYLAVSGCDLFSGIRLSLSFDDGRTWSDFKEQRGLMPIEDGNYLTVGSDATPMYHKKTGKILLLGHTVEYKKGASEPTGLHRYTFYSVFDYGKKEFSKMRFLEMPSGYDRCGNGSGQSIELENGELLIPVYYSVGNERNLRSAVTRCGFDGETLSLIEIGAPMTVNIERGLYEPSLMYHDGYYCMTMRNDLCGYVARSKDGLNYTDLRHWKWDDGEVLPTYNTQQHWLKIGDELYLVYTRRGANNDHVFRHRAPLFVARVENMALVRDSEFVAVPEQGARLVNFGAVSCGDGAFIMAAEWMQPKGCEKYGSDNNIFVARIKGGEKTR